MNQVLQLDLKAREIPSSLRRRVRLYQRLAGEIDSYLKRHPFEWGRYQNQFNMELNGIFREIMNYEKEHLEKGMEEKVYKLKRLFVNKLRKYFLRGNYVKWSLEKPFGYAGDYKIIDDIYQNNPGTEGFDRLYDNYFQMCSICVAVRNRKEDFKRFVNQYVSTAKGGSLNVMVLASGPCRDVKEMISENVELFTNVQFHCFDADKRAIEYAKNLLKPNKAVHFSEMNVLRIALSKQVESHFRTKFDFIYCTGLFDYLDTRISTRLISNLGNLLTEQGALAISDVRDKFSNPSVYFMEWVGDWNLIYREDDDFRTLFQEGGFSRDELSFHYEQQGVMQYVIASRQKGICSFR